MRIAIFASGNGSNAQAIIEAAESKQLNAKIVCLVCDKPEAYVLKRAQQFNLTVLVAAPKDYASRLDWEQAIIDYLTEFKIDLVVLAGFMRIIGENLLNAFPIINIHPSLLPDFPGRHGIEDAFKAGVKETGVTIHWVDSGVDSGPIVSQENILIQDEWTLDELEIAIHKIEHELYPATIQRVVDNWSEFKD